MDERNFKRVYIPQQDNNGHIIPPEERPEDEMGKPLSLSDWGASIKHRMFSKAQKVV